MPRVRYENQTLRRMQPRQHTLRVGGRCVHIVGPVHQQHRGGDVCCGAKWADIVDMESGPALGYGERARDSGIREKPGRTFCGDRTKIGECLSRDERRHSTVAGGMLKGNRRAKRRADKHDRTWRERVDNQSQIFLLIETVSAEFTCRPAVRSAVIRNDIEAAPNKSPYDVSPADAIVGDAV